MSARGPLTACWPFQSRLLSWRQVAFVCVALVGLLFGSLAWAHSSSNSYLTLSMPSQQLTLRADVNLRDLDLIFDLDRDRDCNHDRDRDLDRDLVTLLSTQCPSDAVRHRPNASQ